MAQTANYVSASKPPVAGALYMGATTLTLPTDATTALAAGFTSLGYISEDGTTNDNSPDTEIIKAWGGDPVLTIYNGKEDTFTFRLIEALNVDVLKAVYGDSNVTGTLATGITVTANNNPAEEKAFVIDMVMRNDALKRIVIPAATVTEVGEIEYSDSAEVGYEITLSAQADASGNTHYEYIQAASTSNG